MTSLSVHFCSTPNRKKSKLECYRLLSSIENPERLNRLGWPCGLEGVASCRVRYAALE
jgi:hypothetical protein